MAPPSFWYGISRVSPGPLYIFQISSGGECIEGKVLITSIEHDASEHVTLVVKQAVDGGVIVDHFRQQGDIE